MAPNIYLQLQIFSQFSIVRILVFLSLTQTLYPYPAPPNTSPERKSRHVRGRGLGPTFFWSPSAATVDSTCLLTLATEEAGLAPRHRNERAQPCVLAFGGAPCLLCHTSDLWQTRPPPPTPQYQRLTHLRPHPRSQSGFCRTA